MVFENPLRDGGFLLRREVADGEERFVVTLQRVGIVAMRMTAVVLPSVVLIHVDHPVHTAMPGTFVVAGALFGIGGDYAVVDVVSRLSSDEAVAG